MNSRMDKYEIEAPELKKRSERNKALYNSYDIDNYDKFDVNSNVSVLKNDARSIDVNQIREMLDKKYRDNMPQRRSIDLPEYDEPEIKDDLEDTKEYDLNSILSKVKEERKVDYNVDRLTNSDLSHEIVEKINQKYQKDDKYRDGEEELKNLISTITSLEMKNQKQNADLLGLSDDEATKTVTSIIPQTEETIKEEFYTGKLAVKESDFDDFKEMEDDIKSNSLFIKILIFIVVLIFIGIGIYVANSVFNLGLF